MSGKGLIDHVPIQRVVILLAFNQTLNNFLRHPVNEDICLRRELTPHSHIDTIKLALSEQVKFEVQIIKLQLNTYRFMLMTMI